MPACRSSARATEYVKEGGFEEHRRRKKENERERGTEREEMDSDGQYSVAAVKGVAEGRYISALT